MAKRPVLQRRHRHSHSDQSISDPSQTMPLSVSRVRGSLNTLTSQLDQNITEPLHYAANIFQYPSTWEVLTSKNYGKIKYLWVIAFMIVMAIMMKEVYTLTEELFREELGTRTSYENIDEKFLEKNFKFVFCPDRWLSKSRLEKLNISNELQMYLLGFLTIRVALSDAPTVSPSIVGQTRDLLHRFGSLDRIFVALMKDYGENLTSDDVFFIYNGPGMIHLCFNLNNAAFGSNPLGTLTAWKVTQEGNSTSIGLNLQKNDTIPGFNIPDTFYVTHYSGARLGALIFSLRNIFIHRYKESGYYVNIRHHIHFNGKKNTCIKNKNDDFLPSGYARDYCALQCIDRIMYHPFNCTIMKLLEPNSPSTLTQCNYHHLNEAGFRDALGKLRELQDNCLKSSRCQERYYCSEWEVERKLVSWNQPCNEQSSKLTSKCEMLTENYWIENRIEILTEYPLRTLNNVISDYGGQMGLWVGVSILGFLQLFMHWCVMCKERRIQRKKSIFSDSDRRKLRLLRQMDSSRSSPVEPRSSRNGAVRINLVPDIVE